MVYPSREMRVISFQIDAGQHLATLPVSIPDYDGVHTGHEAADLDER